VSGYRLSHLDELEAESIHIFREVAAEFERPVFLYSVGKDSSCMLRLALKAFHPEKLPFPLLHVDTTFKFKEMYEFREQVIGEIGADLIAFSHPEGKAMGMNPFDFGTAKCCAIWKTRGLLDGLKQGADGPFDAAFGGARREEERSRAKERVYSFRDDRGQWDPKNQRPELWNLYNGQIDPGESIRVFPLSNWTEVDIWHYILREEIPVVPLYFAQPREVIVREKTGQLIPTTEDTRELPGDRIETIKCRFRSLGCVHCSGAVRSEADTVEKIIAELIDEEQSERATRVIDFDRDGSMELKKREGYF